MLGRPTSTITSLLLLTAIASAARGRPFTFVLAISLASYLSLYPLLLFPPLLLLCYDAETRRAKPNAVSNPLTFTVFHTVDLVFTIGSLLFLSRMLMGSWEFISSTYGVHLLLPDLTPNVGLWWYFFIEMFDSFREFFLGVFWLHMSAYVGGLTFRIRRQPLFVVVALLGIFAVFMPYPSIAETGLFLSMIPLYTHVFPRKLSRTYCELAALMYSCSHKICLPRLCNPAICQLPRARFLPSMDLRWFRQRQFLLCYHVGMEPRSDVDSGRCCFCSIAGRVGSRKAGDERKGGSTDLEAKSRQSVIGSHEMFICHNSHLMPFLPRNI